MISNNTKSVDTLVNQSASQIVPLPMQLSTNKIANKYRETGHNSQKTLNLS